LPDFKIKRIKCLRYSVFVKAINK